MPSQTDKIECIPDDQLNTVLEDVEFEELKVISKFKTDCGWTVIYTTQPQSENFDTPLPSPGDGVVVKIGPAEYDALCRVAQSEVGHFGKYGQAQLEGSLSAVVDTIINRAAHKSFPDTIQAVVDQPKQFSAINSTGSWSGLPSARTEIINIIADHLTYRAAGGACSVKGATHFLNPYFSSQNALATWGNYVVANAVAVFGDDAQHDVHYHGFAPGTALPRDYVLEYSGRISNFSGMGVLTGQAQGSGSLWEKIVGLCLEEWQYFDKGSKKESDSPHYNRVGEYWASIGLSYNGRTQIINQATGASHNPPWSSAFISYILKKAGAGNGFKYSQAHCHYVQDFINGRVNAVYEAMHPDHYAPQPGDIVHYGRGSAKQYDFTQARGDYMGDSFYPSHSDIVVKVDSGAAKITTIGGNVSNSVDDKKVDIDGNGKLLPRTEGGAQYPWIAVLRLVR